MTLHLSYASEQSSGTPYSLTLKNESQQAYTFYVFQKAPDQESQNIFSLAWFASPFKIVPDNQIQFHWTIDYNMVWGATGALVPGVDFVASGHVDADPRSANTCGFTVDPGPHLTTPAEGSPAGTLIINDDNNVPAGVYSVGIGMSGAGTFAVQAGPNLTHKFTPTPTYWIGAGNNIQVGKVLDIVTSNPVSEVSYPHNIYDLSYTLNDQNKWEPTK